jgi:hypothetical protein
LSAAAGEGWQQTLPKVVRQQGALEAAADMDRNRAGIAPTTQLFADTISAMTFAACRQPGK